MNIMETINVGEFGVTILSDHVRKVHKNGHEYIALKHNSEYSLKLSNHSHNRCDTSVIIDGRSVGKFRIDPYSTIHIERPATHKRKFVFLEENSGDAYRAGITEGRYANGAVSVTFYPEKEEYRMCRCNDCYSGSADMGFNNSLTHRSYSLDSKSASNFNYMSVNSLSAGATALGDRSSQLFTSVSPLKEIDYSGKRTIAFRMVVDDLEWGMIQVRREKWPTIDDWPSVPRGHIDTHSWRDLYPEHHICGCHHYDCYDRSHIPPRVDRFMDYM
jgi:hypothetical protein